MNGVGLLPGSKPMNGVGLYRSANQRMINQMNECWYTNCLFINGYLGNRNQYYIILFRHSSLVTDKQTICCHCSST